MTPSGVFFLFFGELYIINMSIDTIKFRGVVLL